MGASSAEIVLGGLAQRRDQLTDFYRDLHQFPELSHAETRTAGAVAVRLRELGCEVDEDVGGTGVVGILRNGQGPVVLLRADMDALPVREATGLSYASEVVTVEPGGESVPVMHACGHDVHVTCLLGAVDLLAGGASSWRGTVVAVFQPAEEVGDGARGMVEDGLLAIVGRVDVALAQHVLPFPAGLVRTRSGPTLSAADSMRITVFGRGGHGSMPQAAVDPVVLAALIVIRLQTIVSREITPGEPAVVTVGSLQAGTKSNVIPETATIQLNVRSYSASTRSAVLGAIERMVRASAKRPGHRIPRCSNCSTVSRSPTTIQRPPIGWRRRSLPTSASEPASSHSRPPARTSATSPPPSASRTATGASAESTRRPTPTLPQPVASRRTSP